MEAVLDKGGGPGAVASGSLALEKWNGAVSAREVASFLREIAQESHGVSGNSFSSPDGPDSLGAFALYADLFCINVGGGGDCLSHSIKERAEPRLLGDNDSVNVLDFFSISADKGSDGGQELRAGFVLEGVVCAWEMKPDIPEGGSAEESIAYCVYENIGVGMALKSLIVLDVHAAEDEFASGREWVNIVADSDSQSPHLSVI